MTTKPSIALADLLEKGSDTVPLPTRSITPDQLPREGAQT